MPHVVFFSFEPMGWSKHFPELGKAHVMTAGQGPSTEPEVIFRMDQKHLLTQLLLPAWIYESLEVI